MFVVILKNFIFSIHCPCRGVAMSHVVGVCGLGYVGLPLAVEFGKKFETIGFDLSETKIANYKKFIRPDRRSQHGRPEGRDQAHGVTPTRPAWQRPTSSSSPCRRRSMKRTCPISRRWSVRPPRGQAHEEGCHRRLRIHRLSRRDRRGLHPAAGKAFRHEVEAGFPRRLLARAHQSGRQGTDHHQDRQGRFRRRWPPRWMPWRNCTAR